MNNTTSTCVLVHIYNLPDGLSWIIALYFMFLSVITILENGTIVYSTLTEKRQIRSTIGKVFLSMAVTDLITGVIVLPAYSIIMLSHLLRDGKSCELNLLLLIVGFTMTTISMLTLIVISLNRVLAISRPHLFRSKTYHWAWLGSFFFIWSYSIITAIPPFFGVWSRQIFTLTFSITIVLTLTIPPCGYFYIFSLSRKSGRKIGPTRPRSGTATSTTSLWSGYLNRQRRIARSCSLATFVLIGMYLPQLIARVLETAKAIKNTEALEIIVIICNAIALTNSAVNPWLYARQNVRLRKFTIFRLARLMRERTQVMDETKTNTVQMKDATKTEITKQ